MIAFLVPTLRVGTHVRTLRVREGFMRRFPIWRRGTHRLSRVNDNQQSLSDRPLLCGRTEAVAAFDGAELRRLAQSASGQDRPVLRPGRRASGRAFPRGAWERVETASPAGRGGRGRGSPD